MYAGRLLTWAWRYYRHMACGLGCIDPMDLFEWGSLELAPPHQATSPLGTDAPQRPDPIFYEASRARLRSRLAYPAVCSAPGCQATSDEALQRCGSCRAEAYCSRECQRKAWRTHKSTCALVTTRRRLLDGRDGIAEVARRLLTCYVTTVQSHRELAGWSTAEAERLLLLLTGKKAQSVERSSKARMQEIQAFPVDTAGHPLAHVMAAVCEGESASAIGRATSYYYQHPTSGAACVVLGTLLQAFPSYVPAGPRGRDMNASAVLRRLRVLCLDQVDAVKIPAGAAQAEAEALRRERQDAMAASFISSVAQELRAIVTAIPGTLGISLGAIFVGVLMETLARDLQTDVEGARTLYLAAVPMIEDCLLSARAGPTANNAEVGEPLMPTDARNAMLRKDDSVRDSTPPPPLVMRHAAPLLGLGLVRYAVLTWASARDSGNTDTLLDAGRFLRLASEMGVPSGRAAYGFACAQGRGVPSNPVAGYTQLCMAASANDPDALFLLGLWRRAAAGTEALVDSPLPGTVSSTEAAVAGLAAELERVVPLDEGSPVGEASSGAASQPGKADAAGAVLGPPDSLTATDAAHISERLGIRRSGGPGASHSDDLQREQEWRDALSDAGAKPWLEAAAARGSAAAALLLEHDQLQRDVHLDSKVRLATDRLSSGLVGKAPRIGPPLPPPVPGNAWFQAVSGSLDVPLQLAAAFIPQDEWTDMIHPVPASVFYGKAKAAPDQPVGRSSNTPSSSPFTFY
jgi:hypothetical protein